MISLAIGAPQIILIVVVVLLLFGGKKIPELMRGLGSGKKNLKTLVKKKRNQKIKKNKINFYLK